MSVTDTIEVVEVAGASGVTVVEVRLGVPGPQGETGEQGEQGEQGLTGDPGTIEMFPFGQSGSLIVKAGQSRFALTESYDFESAVASVGTAPTGQAVIVDLNKNGASIFANPANRPTIPVGAFTSGEVVDGESFVPGDYISVDIDQVGSVVAGADLTVVIRLRRTS